MAIKSGTLRGKFNESVERNILCRNGLLMTLAAMKGNSAYSLDDRVKVAKILSDNGTTKEDILKIVPQIEKDFVPTNVQVNKVLAVILGKYTYISDYIANKFLRTVNSEDLGTVKSAWKKNGAALKKYISENEMVEELLTEIGCEHIKYHPNKEYWTCSNPDGDNKSAVVVKNNKYLDVTNYTREMAFDDRPDIISLVRFSRNCGYIEAFDYICDILGINTDLLPKTKIKQTKPKKNGVTDKTEEMKLNVLDENTLNHYTPILYIGWFREGIMQWTRDKFDLRYSYGEKRVIIPLRHWETGELLGVNKRTTVENFEDFGIRKYDLTPSYKKSSNLYGLYENKQSILDKGYVVVYEAEKSVLKRDSLNDPTGVAIQGKFLSNKQVEILLSLNVDIVISLDEGVTIEEVLSICEKLYSQRKNKNIKIYYTIDNHSLLGEKDSIADLGKKAYDLIFAEKVLYDETERKKLETYLGKALS